MSLLYIKTKTGRTISGAVVSLGEVSVEVRGREVFVDNSDRTFHIAFKEVVGVELGVPETELTPPCLEFLRRW